VEGVILEMALYVIGLIGIGYVELGLHITDHIGRLA
jgi:hypothetical protein